MRDRMERFVILPFSVGCISDSTVAVAASLSTPPRRSKSNPDHSSPQETHEDAEENMKNAYKFLALSKSEMPTGIHRLVKSFKTISHLFAYKEEMEEYETGMEIGFPTDVKHVSHIGWEGPMMMKTTSLSGDDWEQFILPDLLPPHHPQDRLPTADALFDPST